VRHCNLARSGEVLLIAISRDLDEHPKGCGVAAAASVWHAAGSTTNCCCAGCWAIGPPHECVLRLKQRLLEIRTDAGPSNAVQW